MQHQSTNFAGYSVYSDPLSKLPTHHATLINTINQYSYCIAEQDADFKQALIGSDVLLPDGVAVVAATRLLSGKRIKKIAGADIHRHFLQELNQKNGSCFYLGASEKTLEKIKHKLSKEYPNIRVGTYSPPFKKNFSKEENNLMISTVNTFKPDALFVGMTAPKQEKWAYQHKKELDVSVICTIGAVFDFYAGTVKRPAKIWINLGLEWFVRLLNEPKRLWRRYLYYGPVFIGMMLKEKAKLMFSRNPDKSSNAEADTKTLFSETNDDGIIARRAG